MSVDERCVLPVSIVLSKTRMGINWCSSSADQEAVATRQMIDRRSTILFIHFAIMLSLQSYAANVLSWISSGLNGGLHKPLIYILLPSCLEGKSKRKHPNKCDCRFV